MINKAINPLVLTQYVPISVSIAKATAIPSLGPVLATLRCHRVSLSLSPTPQGLSPLMPDRTRRRPRSIVALTVILKFSCLFVCFSSSLFILALCDQCCALMCLFLEQRLDTMPQGLSSSLSVSPRLSPMPQGFQCHRASMRSLSLLFTINTACICL